MVVLVILVAGMPFVLFSPILWLFGQLGGGLLRMPLRVVVWRGRLAIGEFLLIAGGVALAVASLGFAIPLDPPLGGVRMIAAGIGLQAMWGLGEIGTLNGRIRAGTSRKGLARMYRRERRLLWVKATMPGRWIVLRLTIPDIYEFSRRMQPVPKPNEDELCFRQGRRASPRTHP